MTVRRFARFCLSSLGRPRFFGRPRLRFGGFGIVWYATQNAFIRSSLHCLMKW